MRPIREHSNSRSWAALLVAPAIFVVLACAGLFGFFIARDARQDEEARLLHERAGEVAALLSITTNQLESSLRLLGEAYAGRGEAGPAFSASARSLLTGSVTGIGVAEVDGDDVIVRAAEGTGAVVGETLPADQADLVRRALEAGDLVTALVASPEGGRTLILALGRDDGRVIFEYSVLPAGPLPSTADSPFRELNAALYRTPTADPENLVLTTSAELTVSGNVDTRTIDVGGEQWLLRTATNSSLAGAQSRAVPWIILGTGLGAAVIAAGVAVILIRRRQFALSLVEERTSELRQTMAELEMARGTAEEANRAKNQFLSRMSHELRTPLNAVLGFAQLLELDDLDDRQKESVSHILKGGNHLLGLINEILDISRIESGDIALSPESVLASEVVTETLDLMRPLAAARSIHIVADRDMTCGHYVFADRQRLKQVLLNLISNAVKYNRPGGSVAVTCEQPSATRLRLNVTDTGPGIRTEDLGLLFVPFERLGANLTDIEGSGIGLALSRRLAEAMGGSLEVESEVGRGSTFWIELPLVEGAVERYERLTGSEPSSSADLLLPVVRRGVLYIEDNLANLKLVQRILEHRNDIELIPAMQGRLGVDLARQHQPALILLDLHLPDIGGDLVLQQLRDDPDTRSIPIVIVSADATMGQVQRLQTAGASAYLTKPLNVAELIRTVDELLPSTTISPPSPTLT